MKTVQNPRLRTAATAALLALAGSLASAATTRTAMETQLSRWLGERPVGVAAAYVDAHGVVFVNAGKFSADDARLVTEDTEFEIGSVTKVFTALLLADGVAAGKVKLEDNVGAPFPASAITYEQLATHTSGLPRLPRDFAAPDPQNPYAAQNLEALVKSFELEAGAAKATSSAEYSNFGFAVLGQALARAEGKPTYETALRENVLQPLGMSDTATSWREADAVRLAPGHDEQGTAGHWDTNAYAPAGALVSTTRELARLVQACLGLVETPLAGALAETMRPRAPADGSGRRVGLAWMVEQTGEVWHNGGTGGFRSVVMLDPAKRVGVVVLTNHARGVEALGKALLKGEAAGSGDPALQKQPAAPVAEALKEYLGNYPLSASFVMAITAEGESLFLQATNQPRLTLRKESADRFSVVGVEAVVTFERGADGKVVALVLHQNGRDMRAPHLAPGEKPPAPKWPKEVALTAEALEAYVGKYRLGAGMFTVKREGTRLMVQLSGQPFFPVFASAKDEFFYKVVEARLSFVRGEEGKVVALVLHQDGRNLRAEKVAE